MLDTTNEPASTIERLQSYMRQVITRTRDVVGVPPFMIFFHPRDDRTFFNYAIPDAPAGAYLHEPMAVLRAEFRKRARRPRFEFIEEFAPDLPPALQANGFAEESRLHLMVCTPTTYHPAPPTPGLTVLRIDAETPLDAIREHLDTNNRGFAPDTPPVAAAEVEEFYLGLGASQAFTAYLHGRAAGAGMFTAPLDGLTELVGITTLADYRRRGIATALTAHATRAAFDQGVEVAFLSAADARAGRVYQRVGFRPFATMVAYIDELT